MLRTIYERNKIDANIIEVNGVAATIDDFKADVSEAGLTPEQEAKLDQIIIDISEVPTLVLDEVAP